MCRRAPGQPRKGGQSVQTTTVTKRLRLQAPDEEALGRRIDTFARALDLRSGVIVSLERPPSSRRLRVAVLLYEFPVQQGSK